jgi:hypothetical protein
MLRVTKGLIEGDDDRIDVTKVLGAKDNTTD